MCTNTFEINRCLKLFILPTLLFTKNNKLSFKRRNDQVDEWTIYICFRMWKGSFIDDAGIKHLL